MNKIFQQLSKLSILLFSLHLFSIVLNTVILRFEGLDYLNLSLIVISIITVLISSFSRDIKESLFYGVISLFSYTLYAKNIHYPDVYIKLYYISVFLGFISYWLSLINKSLANKIKKPILILSFPLFGIVLGIYGTSIIGILSSMVYVLFIIGKLQSNILYMKLIFFLSMPLVIVMDIMLKSNAMLSADILNLFILLYSMITIIKHKKQDTIEIQWNNPKLLNL